MLGITFHRFHEVGDEVVTLFEIHVNRRHALFRFVLKPYEIVARVNPPNRRRNGKNNEHHGNHDCDNAANAHQ